ncbi:MAG: hypothetical protein RL698_2508 [Pseudomonadota bacterium]
MQRSPRFNAPLPGPPLGRRAFLQHSALLAAGVALPSGLMAACGDTSSGSAVEAHDPARPWWLQADYAPVADEIDAFDLRIRGRIPAGLDGLYVRNGSNPQKADSPHWFFGDGMIHGVRIADGKALWYRNRYVQTLLYQQGISFGDPSTPPVGGANQSNVSTIWHGGKLLTSGEVGFPYEIDPRDLSTKGVYDFGGRLKTSFTAHPQVDPTTGHLHYFGYWFFDPFLTYSVADASGRVISSEKVDVRATTMMHSFAITERDVVFWECPVLFSLDDAIAGALNPFHWQPDYGTRVGIMPLGGRTSEIRWVEIENCYVFHSLNAYRDGNEVVVDVCRHPDMFTNDDLKDSQGDLRRWRIDTGSSPMSFRDEVVTTEPFELPQGDRRFTGRRHRYGWYSVTRANPNTVDFGGTGYIDYETGRVSLWDPGATRHAGEPFFVPGGEGEGNGWLFTYVYDHRDGRSTLAILPALDLNGGPVAEIELPRRIPYGFHGVWVPGGGA